jgi:TonB family protein
MLNQRLTDELDQITGLDEGLKAEAEFEVQASGRLARGRIVKTSRNERFDQAVLHAIAVVRMPEGPPKGFDRVQTVTFRSQSK